MEYVPSAGATLAARCFFITVELVEHTLLSKTIPPSQLLITRGVSKSLRDIVDGTPSLQRKVFKQAQRAEGNTKNEEDNTKNEEHNLNTLWIPTNFGQEPFPTYYANKLRIATPSIKERAFELHWATHEDIPVLCIELFTKSKVNLNPSGFSRKLKSSKLRSLKSAPKPMPVINKSTQQSYLSNKNTGVVAVVKSARDEEKTTKLWIPGYVNFEAVLNDVAMWDEDVYEEIGGDWLYFDANMKVDGGVPYL